MQEWIEHFITGTEDTGFTAWDETQSIELGTFYTKDAAVTCILEYAKHLESQTMTDRQKLINLFTEFGVDFKSKEKSNRDSTSITDTDIVCSEGDDKIGGYQNHFVRFEFAENGSFQKMRILE